MSKKWLILVMTLIVLLVTMPLLAACSDDDDEEETLEPTKTVEPTETAQPTETVAPTETQAPTKTGNLTIGWLCTIYGTSATARDHSIDLAVKEINEAGGVQVGDTTYTLDLVVEDDKGSTTTAVAGIQKLLYEDDIDIVIHAGAGTYVTRPYTDEEKVLQFASVQAEAYISPEYTYSFFVGSDRTIYDLILLDWASKNRPDIKTVASLKQLTTEEEDHAKIYQKLAPVEYGIEFASIEFFESTTRDFYPVLTNALQENPDALILHSVMGFMLAKQARELGFEGQYLVAGDMPEHWYGGMLTDEELDGIISLSPPLDSPEMPQYYKDYLEAYYEMQNTTPYDYEFSFMNFYIPTYLYAAALKAAGSTDADKVAEVLETQTLTVEFPNGEKLDIRLFGQDQFGANRYVIPTPEYLSVNRMDKPELIEVIEQDQLYEYRALYDKYRLAD